MLRIMKKKLNGERLRTKKDLISEESAARILGEFRIHFLGMRVH